MTQGPTVTEFEERIVDKVGAKYAIAMNSATSALHVSCLALGIGRGDTIWTVPTSFVASANCAYYCGGKSDFVDIETQSGLISIKELEKKLSNSQKEGNYLRR